MKKTLCVYLILLSTMYCWGQEIVPVRTPSTPETTAPAAATDSLLVQQMRLELEQLKSANEDLLNSLNLTSQTLNDLVRDKRVSDETKWRAVKANILHSVQMYRILSEDIIDLKSRLADEEYQGYIRSLGSLQEGPLGFSFQDVILESIKESNMFEKSSKLEGFVEVARTVMNSPIISSIPFVSNAVAASSSILDIAYGAALSDKKVNFEKMRQFEAQLNKYILYYTTLDKANIQNQASNSDRRVLLENLQIDLLTRLRKEAPRLKYTLPDRESRESIDAYFNRIFRLFNNEYAERYLSMMENRYRTSRGEIRYADLLQNETDVKFFNNGIGTQVELAKKYILYYDNFFEVANNYQNRVLEAIDLARQSGIIETKKEGGRELTPEQVYQTIVESLQTKKERRDNGIINSINIEELKQKLEAIEDFKLL